MSYVKSPVASLCFTCSSVRNLVSVTMWVLTFSPSTGLEDPFVAMMICVCGVICRGVCSLQLGVQLRVFQLQYQYVE